jgi:xanthine dehydrogenase YagS FAD-binding subunit
MKAFELLNPATLESALELLPKDAKTRDSVKLLAGGQDLITEMKEHLVEPAQLVNLKRVPGLDRLEIGADGSLAIGALVTIAALEESADVRKLFPVLAQAAHSIGSAQIRSQGTVGGNLNQRPRCWYYRNEHAVCLKKGGSECFSYSGLNKYNAILGGGPSYIVHPSDLAPALVALEAEATLKSKKGERKIALEKFYTLPAQGDATRETVLEPGEVLTEVRVPARKGWSSTYVKFKERGSYDFALASVALAIQLDAAKAKIADARLVLGGVAPIPWRSSAAEKKLAGASNDAKSWSAAADEALRGAEPLQYNAYKVPLAKGLIVQAFEELSRS